MNKNKNSYLMIGIILLFVVVIIVGAGLCYLSWDNDAEFTEGQTAQADVWTEEVYEAAKQEGRQELLEYVREGMEAGVDAEAIITGLFTDMRDPEQIEQEQAADKGTVETDKELEQETEEIVETVEVVQEREPLYKGIDVSKYQAEIDWQQVAADGVDYAFIRVGYRGYGDSGSLVIDEKFHQNIKGVLAQGLKAGAYFFSQAVTTDEAVQEAELVLEELEGYEITYPVAIYIEQIEEQNARQDKLSKEKRTEICKAFCDRIEQAGYIPMVYGDAKTFTELIDAEALKAYAFWIYDTDGTAASAYDAAVWQYSHEGTVSGISTETNLSVSYKEW